jgi:hypothetical protein
LPIVPTDDWLLIVPTDDNGMDELRRRLMYRIAVWFDRLCCVWLLLWFIGLLMHAPGRVIFVVLLCGLVTAGSSIVLKCRAGVPTVRPSKWNAPARERWRQFNRDVLWLPRR